MGGLVAPEAIQASLDWLALELHSDSREYREREGVPLSLFSLDLFISASRIETNELKLTCWLLSMPR